MVDEQRIAEAVLALMHLTAHEQHGETRAWKTFDWDALDRLHEQGMISNPKSKAKSVALSEAGARRARELFDEFFANDDTGAATGSTSDGPPS